MTDPKPDKAGDFRQRMISRLQKIHEALRQRPQGVTHAEFVALAQKVTGGVTKKTAESYVQIMDNCGYTRRKIIDLGHWKAVTDTLPDGSTRTRHVMTGETMQGPEQTLVFKTEQRIFAGRKAPGDEVSDRELQRIPE